MSTYHTKQLAKILPDDGSYPPYGISMKLQSEWGETLRMTLTPEAFKEIQRVLADMKDKL